MGTKAAKQPGKILFVFRSQFLCSNALACSRKWHVKKLEVDMERDWCYKFQLR